MENMFDGILEFPSNTELEAYLSTIEKDDALKLLELAIMYGQKHGLYNLTESHCLYICLKKLKERYE